MKVCLGGTFDTIHKGHKKLIDKAFKTAGTKGSVFIGLSAGKLIDKKQNVKPWGLRKKELNRYIFDKGHKTDFVIKPINDRFGPTIKKDFDAIIVSPETIKTAEEINNKREELSKKPLKIVKIPYVLADDNMPISSTRIRENEIDSEGRTIRD